MQRYDATTYGERAAGVYDDWYGEYSEAMIDRLAELAQSGPALELGIGTGRVALPLRERGVAVHGIDASEAMVARLRQKPGGAAIPVTMGDFGRVAVEGRFALVYVVFNTFFALLSQEDQVCCFQAVAEHLTPEGVFVLQAFVPDVGRFDRGQRVSVTRVDNDAVHLECSRHDPVNQRVTSHHVVMTPAGVQLYPVQVRFSWPSELDLMARLAGLRLRHRWGDWDRQPFTAASKSHVSVYERGEP
jgi:SAM-dependent methyltransferase